MSRDGSDPEFPSLVWEKVRKLSERSKTLAVAASSSVENAMYHAERASLAARRPVQTPREAEELRQLTARCEQLVEQIRKVQKTWRAPPAAGSEATQSSVLLAEKEKALVSAITVAKKGVVFQKAQYSEPVVMAQLSGTLNRSISEYDEAIASLKSQIAARASELKKQRSILQERGVIQQALSGASSGTNDASAPRKPSAPELRQEYHALSATLASFLDLHFSAEVAASGKRKRDDTSVLDAPSLKELLQDLLSRAVSSPDSPYVSTEGHLPEHVQLLLRARVADAHPNDEDRIRLVDFLH
jgi:hypothetical protein